MIPFASRRVAAPLFAAMLAIRAAPAPPGELPADVRDALDSLPRRVVSTAGASIDVWPVRRGASAPAATPRSNGMRVNYGFLVPGHIVGAVRVVGNWSDARGQAIPPGVYTLRYAVQPLRKEHMGVSPYRDFLVLVGAAAGGLEMTEEEAVAASRAAAGGSHPIVLTLVPPATPEQRSPSSARDADPNVLRLMSPDGREIHAVPPLAGGATREP